MGDRNAQFQKLAGLLKVPFGDKLNGIPITKYNKLNLSQLPKNIFSLYSEEEVEQFTLLYRWVVENTEQGYECDSKEELKKIVEMNKNTYSYYVVCRITSCVVYIYVKYIGILFSFSIRDDEGVSSDKKGKKIYGRTAFKAFENELAKDNISLKPYALDKEKAWEWKQKIPKPVIKGTPFLEYDKTYENVHHIDFNSSYAAGLINTHPEFKTTLERIYENRKKDNGRNKAILNLSIGYMQSSGINYKYSQLVHDAHWDNIKRLVSLADRLLYSGRKVLLFNTDGIWYQGEIYHDENEGNALGQWKNDHLNCKLRVKSAGSYEYIENDTYHPVVRGKTKLDNIKNREHWQWGDIYQANEIIKYEFTFEKGLIKYYEEVK